MSEDHRLDRIEEKIDRLTDALVSIARTEEKLVSMEQKYSAQYDRMNRFSEKVDMLEQVTTQNSQTVSTINKLFWIALVAAAGVVMSNLLM